MGKGRLQKTFKSLIITAAIAALTLMGTVPSFAADKVEEPRTEGASAILMDAETGEILYEKNARQQRDPASITKVVNCLVVLERLELGSRVTIDYDPEKEGSVMHLKQGEQVSIRELIHAMMVWSANDAAEALARITAGDETAFCALMNSKAKELGAENTIYRNPNGLNKAEINNLTTAYDIALISAEAMDNPEFADIVSARSYSMAATNLSEKRNEKSSNRCLWDDKTTFECNGRERPLKYEGCKGIKTGYSSTAGYCFTGFAERGDTQLIAVVLNAPDEDARFRDAVRLWDYGFSNFKTYRAAAEGSCMGKQRIKGGSLREVDLALEDDLAVTVEKDYETPGKTRIEVKTQPEGVKAPVKEGELLGEALLLDEEGRILARQNLVSLENAETGGPLSRIGIADEDAWIFIIVASAFALTVIAAFAMIMVRRKRKNKPEKNV